MGTTSQLASSTSFHMHAQPWRKRRPKCTRIISNFFLHAQDCRWDRAIGIFFLLFLSSLWILLIKINIYIYSFSSWIFWFHGPIELISYLSLYIWWAYYCTACKICVIHWILHICRSRLFPIFPVIFCYFLKSTNAVMWFSTITCLKHHQWNEISWHFYYLFTELKKKKKFFQFVWMLW